MEQTELILNDNLYHLYNNIQTYGKERTSYSMCNKFAAADMGANVIKAEIKEVMHH